MSLPSELVDQAQRAVAEGRAASVSGIRLNHLAPLAVHAIKFVGAYPAALANAIRALA